MKKILEKWRKIGIKGKSKREKWYKVLNNSKYNSHLKKIFSGKLSGNIEKLLLNFKNDLAKNAAPMATRKASETALYEINKIIR